MKSIHPIILLAFLTLPAAPPLAAASPTGPDAWCGTHPATPEVLAARHEAFRSRLERERSGGRIPLKSSPLVSQNGNIAVIQDDGTLVIPPRPFDLHGRAMQFLRRPKGVSAVRSRLTFKQLIGERLALGDDDSIRLDFPAGFRFPFGNQVYTSVWVNSDGNLTFGRPDSASTARSLERFLIGPPRIAPLFTDLDPSAAAGENGVYVSFPPNRVRLTWMGVPEFGGILVNTFQVTLFTTGRVNFAYGDSVRASDAIVGVAPFADGDLHLIDYNVELPFRPQRVAIAEEFTRNEDVDLIAVARAFYSQFQDAYQFLSVWEDFPINLAGGAAFAFATFVKNGVRGIGLPDFDLASAHGSAGRLETVVQMGHVENYSGNPNQLVNRTYTSMATLAHEVGHRWLTFVNMVEENGLSTSRLIGAGFSHWSHFLDADGSLMEGNDYEDRGDGSFIITDRTTTHFSSLDQYLMGLISPAQVEDFFYIDNPNRFNQADITLTSRIGSIVIGDRVDASVDSVIAAEGRRTPGAANSRKSFRTAFILLARQGEQVSQASIDLLDTLRTQFPGYFQDVTDNHATMSTALFPK